MLANFFLRGPDIYFRALWVKRQNRGHYAQTYITPKNLTIQKHMYVHLWMIHVDVWQKTT